MVDIPRMMKGVVLPGDSTVVIGEYEVPEPGPGQVLLKVKASSICGSDIRAIYRAHLGSGPEAYQGVIAGHEPCGRVVKLGPGCRARTVGQRVVVYHISGCGCCPDCWAGYQISCRSRTGRRAYGWRRNGGHAQYLLAEERDCIPLPDNLSEVDGAFTACGYGTVWECLRRMNVSGADRLLITGLGPVGLAAAQLGRMLGVPLVLGVERAAGRLELARSLMYRPDVPLLDHVIDAEDDPLDAVVAHTGGEGCEVSVDCSGSAAARRLALEGTRAWGRCGFIGEGGKVEFDVSPLLIHKQITLYGSWVTSLPHLAELLAVLSRHDVHPQLIAGPLLPLNEAAKAYTLADEGHSGKV